jgi:hypothetical protein
MTLLTYLLRNTIFGSGKGRFYNKFTIRIRQRETKGKLISKFSL